MNEESLRVPFNIQRQLEGIELHVVFSSHLATSLMVELAFFKIYMTHVNKIYVDDVMMECI